MTKRNHKTGLTVANLASFFEERCKYLYIKLAAFLAPTSIIVIDCSLLRPLFFSSLPRSSSQCSLCDSCFNRVYTVSHNIITSTTIAQRFFSILISLGIATAPYKHASRNGAFFFRRLSISCSVSSLSLFSRCHDQLDENHSSVSCGVSCLEFSWR